MDDLMTLKETAKYLKIHINTLRRWLKEGRIQGHRIGRKWMFLDSEIIEQLKEK